MATTEERLAVRIEASLAQFERQMAKANRTSARTAGSIEQNFTRANQRVVRSSRDAGRALGSIGGQGRFAIQNTANQIGDLAVQIGSGQSAARALGQQLPQLLGGFGALGSVLGTVAAIGIPLGAAFLAMGDNAETAAVDIDALGKALGAYDGRAKEARQAIIGLSDAFSIQAAAAAEVLQSQAGLARADALQALEAAVASLTGRFGELSYVQGLTFDGLEQALENANSRGLGSLADQLEAQIDALQGLQEGFRLTEAEAIGLGEALFAVRNAPGLDEQAQALLEVRRLLEGVTIDLTLLPPEARKFLAELNTAAGAALTLGANVEDVEINTSRAAAEAARLADEFIRANNVAQQLRRFADEDALLSMAVAVDENAVDRIRALRRQLDAEATQAAISNGGGRGQDPRIFDDRSVLFQGGEAPARQPRRSRGRTNNAAAEALREENRLREQALRIIETTATADEQRAAQLRDMNEARRQFVASFGANDPIVGQLDLAIERFQLMESSAATIAQTLNDGLQAAVFQGDNLGNVLQGVVRQLLSIASQQFLQAAFLGTSPSGLAGSIAGALSIPGYAGGTNYHPGGLAVVGERGPELVNLPRGSQVFPNGTGPGGGMSFNPTINVNGVQDPAAVKNAVVQVLPVMRQVAVEVVRDNERRR